MNERKWIYINEMSYSFCLLSFDKLLFIHMFDLENGVWKFPLLVISTHKWAFWIYDCVDYMDHRLEYCLLFKWMDASNNDKV